MELLTRQLDTGLHPRLWEPIPVPAGPGHSSCSFQSFAGVFGIPKFCLSAPRGISLGVCLCPNFPLLGGHWSH